MPNGDWNSRIMPPLTMQQLDELIMNRPNFKTYVVFAKKSDSRWALAKSAEKLFPNLRSYLVLAAGQAEFRDMYHMLPMEVGFVFSTNGRHHVALMAAGAGDFLTIAQAIAEV